MNKIFWYIVHSFRYSCPDLDLETRINSWNPKFPNHFTPKHICKKCGREWIRGIVYSDEPWPDPPNKL